MILIVLIVGCSQEEQRPMTYQELHQDALVVDLHSDAVLRMMDGADFGVRDTTGHMDIPRLRDGGIDLQVMVCWLPTETPLEECRPHVDSMIDSLDAQIDRYADQVALCRTAAEAEQIVDQDKIAIFLGIENGVAIANDIDNLQHFYDRGVRYLTLTHTASNDWCISSADDEPAFDGLTEFGRDVVRKMNELGMIVDISHLHESAVAAVLEVTTDPVVASHSCVRALCEHNRNLTDDQIKAVAANGGVIGINFYNGYLSSEWSEAFRAARGAYSDEIDSLRAIFGDDQTAMYLAMRPIYEKINIDVADSININVGTVVDHIDHIVKLVGADYVCFGSDFDGVFNLPAGLEDCSGVPNITKELVERGYAEEDIRKILGENFMRVFAAVCDN